ncbi:hypothetical protein JST97_14125 [bacterium]|nr:hypothetical protein [bacterium]
MTSGRLYPLLFCFVFWFISSFSPYAGQQADTWGSLLSAQAWLEHGSPELSPYDQHLDLYAYQIYHNDRGFFYAYPPFPVLLEIPAVALARLVGMQMWDRGAEGLVQRQVVALSLSLLLALLAYGYRALMSERAAWLWAFLSIAAGACLGSLGAAFNSQLPAIFFMTAAQMLFLREAYGRGPWRGWQIGSLLALSYMCRPTGALWAAVAILYVLWRKPGQLGQCCLALGMLLGVYTLGCWLFFGTPVHPYFLGRELMLNPVDFSYRLVGILWSPGVGLFVYQPLLLLAFLLGPLRLWRQPLFWCLYGYVLMHLAVVALQWDWWGGSTFGPRLTAETVIPLSIIAMMMGPKPRWLRPLLILGLGWSLWINIYAAYFRSESHRPLGFQFYFFDEEKSALWDWQLAPFWVSAARIQQLQMTGPDDILAKLGQHNRRGFGNLERAGDQLYVTPREQRSEISFLSNPGQGAQSGSISFRYDAPRPVHVGLNGHAWTVLPASSRVHWRTVFFENQAWGSANRLSFDSPSGVRLFDLEIQNWNAGQPGGLTYREGWGMDEARPGQPPFRWSYGPFSQLGLTAPRGGRVRLNWRGNSPRPGTQVRVAVNGREQARILNLPDESQPIQMDLLVGPGSNSIEFRYNQWGSTSKADQRPLALAFQDLRLSWAP